MKEIIIPGEGRPIGEFAEEVGQFFNDKKILFFRPTERQVIKIGEQSVGTDENKKVLVFQPVEKAEFITLLEKYLDIGVFKRTSENPIGYFVAKSITQTTAEITLSSEYQFRAALPVVERIFHVPMPFIKNGALIFPKVGYDEELKSWMPESAPKINETMTLAEAKAIFEKMYGEFCFKAEQDKHNAIALLMTPYCRGLYVSSTSRTPIGFYKANRERAGKDYCAGITGIIHEGSAIQDAPLSDGENKNADEELRKKLLSTFKIGRSRIHSSNNKGHINSAILESIATTEYWEDRQLGSNLMLRFPNTLEISISANAGITYTPDLSARCVFVNLFFAEEDPNDRQFTIPNLHEWVEEHKDEVVSAMFTLVKNWFEKGKPPGTKPFASFPEWARVVGGIMESAGYLNPCNANDDMVGIGGDTETRDMKRLFELCYQTWPNTWIVKKKVFDAIETPDTEFSTLFGHLKWGVAGSNARSRFAIILSRFVNRQLSGIVLECNVQSNTTRNEYRWSKMDDLRQKPKQRQVVGDVGDVGYLPLPIYETLKNNIQGEKGINPYKPYKNTQNTNNVLENNQENETFGNSKSSNIEVQNVKLSEFDIYGTIINSMVLGVSYDFQRLIYDLGAKGYDNALVEAELERLEHEGEISRPRPDTVKRVR